MSVRLVLCFAVVAVAVSNVMALTQEGVDAIQGSVLKYITECSEEYNITEDQLKEAKEKKSLEGIEPCAIGCFFKKAKYINDEGKYDADKAKEASDKLASNEEDKKQFAEIADECASVNDQDVSDGDKGCERAKLLLTCLDKHKDALLM